MTTTLPASGPISIRDFNEAMEGALGFTPTRNTSLNDPAIRANLLQWMGLPTQVKVREVLALTLLCGFV